MNQSGLARAKQVRINFLEKKIEKLNSEIDELKASQWISVKDHYPDDELPKKNVEVFGALKGCDSGKYIIRPIERVNESDHSWQSEGYEIANCWDVTHWMPIPEPPLTDKGE